MCTVRIHRTCLGNSYMWNHAYRNQTSGVRDRVMNPTTYEQKIAMGMLVHYKIACYRWRFVHIWWSTSCARCRHLRCVTWSPEHPDLARNLALLRLTRRPRARLAPCRRSRRICARLTLCRRCRAARSSTQISPQYHRRAHRPSEVYPCSA
jgi:hypothetical protein